jgi:hypothetical protein
MTAQKAKASRKIVITRRNRATLAHGDYLGWVKREYRQIAMAAGADSHRLSCVVIAGA